MTPKEIAASDIAQISLFKALDKKDWAAIATKANRKNYKPYEIVYPAGAHLNKLIYIEKGSATVYHALADRSVPLSILSDGATWGAANIILPGHKHESSLIANPNTLTTIEIPITELLKFLQNHKTAQVLMLHAIAKEALAKVEADRTKISLLTGLADMAHNDTQQATTTLLSMLTSVTQALNAGRGLIAWFDTTTLNAVIEEIYNYTPELRNSRHQLHADTILSMVFNTKKSHRIGPDNFEQKFTTAPYACSSMLLTPLFSHNMLYGALLVAEKKSTPTFSLSDELLVIAAAPLIATKLAELHIVRNDLHHRRIKDRHISPLTK